ncbi:MULTISPECIES: hypothetical protein [unclassified Caballeronia]|uniref:hypothetical protein n=1 Tax=unclassified Caballeronia TaxID=2646786 RepID=UPI0020279939|nr:MULTISPECIES: hypothetical protein [unclassified Caballeronia]
MKLNVGGGFIAADFAYSVHSANRIGNANIQGSRLTGNGEDRFRVWLRKVGDFQRVQALPPQFHEWFVGNHAWNLVLAGLHSVAADVEQVLSGRRVDVF